MKNLIIVCLLIIGIITVGCSSGGGSSKPSSNLSGPTISYISPVSGNSDTLITIYGSRFGLYQGSSILSYGGVTVTPSSWQDTQITVKLPASSLSDQKFLVNVGGVFSNESTPFAFSDMRIFNITPNNGSPGSVVTISGQGFGTFVSDVTYVTFYDLSQTANYVCSSRQNLVRYQHYLHRSDQSVDFAVGFDRLHRLEKQHNLCQRHFQSDYADNKLHRTDDR